MNVLAPSVNSQTEGNDARQRRYIAELATFLRFPSISAHPAHDVDVRRCCHWLAGHLQRIGMSRVTVIPTRRHPAVYAEWLGSPGKPTLLVYGHYDVQPVDPIGAWPRRRSSPASAAG
jgi:acetylornithine deacetylase/succinyl-diaminopimelate desuccinylase-like protein